MEIKGTYRHYKGNNYEVIGEAIDNLTKEEYIFIDSFIIHLAFGSVPEICSWDINMTQIKELNALLVLQIARKIVLQMLMLKKLRSTTVRLK